MTPIHFELQNGDELVTSLKYGTRELIFSTHYISTVAKRAVTSDDIYTPVNQFLLYPWDDFREKLFNAYERILGIMDSNDLHLNAYRLIRDEITTLFDQILTYEILRDWVGSGAHDDNKSGLVTPSNLVSDQYNDSDSETTFRQDEYRDLLVLSMVSRFMIPIWAHFINRYSEGMLEDFKESMVFNLLQGTWVRSCKIMQFMEKYIQESIRAKVNSTKKEPKVDMRSINIGGISEHGLPMYLIAMTMLRRMGCMNLYGKGNENSNLVNILYSYAIVNLLPQLPSKLAGRIMLKRNLDPSSDSQSRGSSIIDKCRVIQTTHVGIHAVHAYYAERMLPKILDDMIDLVNSSNDATIPKLDRTFILPMLPRCIEIATECDQLLMEDVADTEVLEAYTEFDKYRRLIVSNWLGNVFNHAEIRLLDSVGFSNLAGLLTAILINMGHVDLAIIINSRPVLSEESLSADGSSIDSGHCDQFLALYPRHEQFSEKEKSKSNFLNKLNTGARREKNQIIKAIEGLTALIPYLIWNSGIKVSDLVAWGVDIDKEVMGRFTNKGQFIAYSNRKILLVNAFLQLGKINQ